VAKVDGIWQISDSPVDIAKGTEYDKTTIQNVSPATIVMEDENNDITLSKNMEISMMPGVNIKTADSGKLRY
jgi:hypothetical protein